MLILEGGAAEVILLSSPILRGLESTPPFTKSLLWSNTSLILPFGTIGLLLCTFTQPLRLDLTGVALLPSAGVLAEVERICLVRLDVLRTGALRVEWAGVPSGEEREEELALLALPLPLEEMWAVASFPLEENRKEKGEEECSLSSLDTFGCSLGCR